MSKKARSEGARVAGLIKANKAQFYIADVDLEDDSKDVLASLESVIKTLGKTKCDFLLISAGVTNLTVACSGENAREWLLSSVSGISTDQEPTCHENVSTISINIDTPFKLKDIVRANGFAYLKQKGFMDVDESSEEFVGFDDL